MFFFKQKTAYEWCISDWCSDVCSSDLLIIAELLKAGPLHEDVATVAGQGLRQYTQEPFLNNGQVEWRTGETRSRDTDVIRPANTPFSHDGGLKMLTGNLGRAVIRVSAEIGRASSRERGCKDV